VWVYWVSILLLPESTGTKGDQQQTPGKKGCDLSSLRDSRQRGKGRRMMRRLTKPTSRQIFRFLDTSRTTGRMSGDDGWRCDPLPGPPDEWKKTNLMDMQWIGQRQRDRKPLRSWRSVLFGTHLKPKDVFQKRYTSFIVWAYPRLCQR
jgi:hypothetical protein